MDAGKVNAFLFTDLMDAFEYIQKNADQNKITITKTPLTGCLLISGFNKNKHMEEFTIEVPPTSQGGHVHLITKGWLGK